MALTFISDNSFATNSSVIPDGALPVANTNQLSRAEVDISTEVELDIPGVGEFTASSPVVFEGGPVQASSVITGDASGFAFTVTIVDNDGNPVNITPGTPGFNAEAASIAAITEAALENWGTFINGADGAVIDVELTVDSQEEGTIASAGPGGFFFTEDGLDNFIDDNGNGVLDDGEVVVIEAVTAVELQTGVDLNGDDSDINITVNQDVLDSGDFHLDAVDFDPVTGEASVTFADEVPAGLIDLFSVLVHEVGHGLGFIGLRDTPTDDLFPFETPDGTNVFVGTLFDVFTNVSDPSRVTFDGPATVAAYGEAVALEIATGDPGSDLGHFVGSEAGFDTALSILNPFVIPGDRVNIGALTLSVLADLGYDVNIPTDLSLVNEFDPFADAVFPVFATNAVTAAATSTGVDFTINASDTAFFTTISSSVGVEISGDGFSQSQRVQINGAETSQVISVDLDTLLGAGGDSGFVGTQEITVDIRFFNPAQAVLGNGSNQEFSTINTGILFFGGTGGTDSFDGTNNVDIIFGRSGDDVIAGNGGDDQIVAGSGADVITGGLGNDSIEGGSGADNIQGGAGADEILGNQNDDFIDGGSGDDTISGGSGNDELRGGADNDALTGNFGSDSLFGDAGDDTLFGNQSSDILNGGDGDDTLDGGSSGDDLFGEAGNDTLFGQFGSDELNGGLGNDTLFGNQNSDILRGGDGDDTLDGGSSGDVLFGDAGSDTLFGQFGSDELNGGLGNDTLFGNQNSDVLRGGDGDDDLDGGSGGDELFGDAGSDTLFGQFGNDVLNGGVGNDMLFGNQNSDILNGGDGDDTLDGGSSGDDLFGEAGNDTLFGRIGNDELNGGAGNDMLFGNQSSDILRGGDGEDTLDGGTSGDDLFGDAGNDTLFGGSGSDDLNGGTGDDILTGGANTDRFEFGADFGNDTVVDFSNNETLNLSALGVTSLADLSIVQDGANTVITINGDAENSITLEGITATSINENDFIFDTGGGSISASSAPVEVVGDVFEFASDDTQINGDDQESDFASASFQNIARNNFEGAFDQGFVDVPVLFGEDAFQLLSEYDFFIA